MPDTPSCANLTMETVKLIAGGVHAMLVAHISAMGATPALSADTVKHIRKRVLPRLVGEYSTPDRAIGLLSLDIEDLGLRICRYRYIERYQEAVSFDDREMGAAFVSHIHCLRGSEIYVIQERGSEVLSFLQSLASDLGVGAGSQKAAFEKAFKKQFERHLRERHRIVHAHERPSLVSRMTSLSPSDCDDPGRAEILIDVLTQFFPMAAKGIGLDKAETMDLGEIRQKVKAFQLDRVEEEMASMWQCFLTALERTFDPAFLRQPEISGTSNGAGL